MADDIKFVASIVPQIDASNMSGGISQLQEYFNKLKLPPKLGDGFKDLFTDAIGKAEKFQDVLAKGGKDKRSFSELTRSADSALDAIDRIQKKMNSISDEQFLSNLEINPDIFKDVDRQIEETEQKIKESFEKLGKIDISGIEKARDALQQLSSSNAIGQIQQNFEKAFSTGDFSKIEDTMRVLISNMLTFGAAKDKVKDGIEQIRKSFAEGNFGAVSEEFRDLLGIMPKLNDPNITQGEEKLRRYIKQVQILFNAFKNSKDLDVTNLTVELDKLKESRENLEKEYQNNALGDFKQAQQGVTAYAQGMRTAEKSVRDTQKAQVDLNTEIGQLKNRIQHFFGLVNAVQLFRRALKDTFNTVKELDASMTETAVVTDFTVGDMWDQLPQYTATAKEFGATIKGVYDVMTLYYQQGLNQDTAWALGTETLKLARIAGLDYAEATDRMTNALRGFNMELNQQNAQRVDDVYSKLAAMSASNVDELSVAMTKTASIAKSANMEFETTAAFLAQIIETTREAPETAGTALKTVIARFSEVKDLYTKGQLTGEDSEGEKIDVNKVSKALGTAGIDMSKYFTGEVGLDTIFMELAEKWDSLDLVQQRYIATQAAGSRQQSRFIAMLSDYGRTLELVEGAENSAGASQGQFEKTQESLENKLNRLKDTWQEFLMGIANSSAIKTGIDLLNGLLTIVNKLTTGFGPLSNSILKVGAAIATLKSGGFLLNKGIESFGSKFGSAMGIKKSINSESNENNITGFHPILKTTQKMDNFTNRKIEKMGGGSVVTVDANTAPAESKLAAFKTKFKAMKAAMTETPVFFKLDDNGALVKLETFDGKMIETNQVIESSASYLQELGISTEEAAEKLSMVLSTGAEQGATTVSESLTIVDGELEQLDVKIDELQAKLAALEQKYGLAAGSLTNVTELGQDEANQILNHSKGGNDALHEAQTLMEDRKEIRQRGVDLNKGKQVAGLMEDAGEEAGGAYSKGFNARWSQGQGTLGSKFAKIATAMGSSGGALAGAAYVVAFAAAIVAIGAVIYAAYKSSASQVQKAVVEDLKSSVKGLKESLDTVNSQYEDLVSNISELTEINNTMDALVEGSQAWTKALLENNRAILDIIENYPELSQVLKIEPSGKLSLPTEELNKLQQKQINQIINLNKGLTSRQKRLNYEEKIKTLNESENASFARYMSASHRRVLTSSSDLYEQTHGKTDNFDETYFSSNEDKQKYFNYVQERKNIEEEYKKSLASGARTYVNEEVSEPIKKAAENYAYNIPTVFSPEELEIGGKKVYKQQFGKYDVKNATAKDVNTLSDDILAQIGLERVGNNQYKAIGAKNGQIYEMTEHGGIDTWAEIDTYKKKEKGSKGYRNIDAGFIMSEAAKLMDEQGVQEAAAALAMYTPEGLANTVNGMIDERYFEENGDVLLNKDAQYMTNLYKDIKDKRQEQQNIIEGKDNNGKPKKYTEEQKENAREEAQRLDNLKTIIENSYDIDASGQITTDSINASIKKSAEDTISSLQYIYGANFYDGDWDGMSDTKKMDLTKYQKVLTNFENVDGLTKYETMDAYKTAMDNIKGENKEVEKKELTDFASTIDTTSAIQGYAQITKGAKSETKAIKEMSEQMKKNALHANNMYSAQNQLKELLSSEEYANYADELQKIAETSDITATNIYELANSNQLLNTALQNGAITAGTLAEVYERIIKDGASLNDFTQDFIEYLNELTYSATSAAQALNFVNNFQAPQSQVEAVAGWQNWASELDKYAQVGAYNDQYFTSLLKNFASEDQWTQWEKEDVDNETRYAALKNTIQTQASSSTSYGTLAAGASSAEGAVISSNGNGLTFNLSNPEIKTTKDLIEGVAEQYHISEEYANALIADARVYNTELDNALKKLEKQNAFKKDVARYGVNSDGFMKVDDKFLTDRGYDTGEKGAEQYQRDLKDAGVHRKNEKEIQVQYTTEAVNDIVNSTRAVQIAFAKADDYLSSMNGKWDNGKEKLAAIASYAGTLARELGLSDNNARQLLDHMLEVGRIKVQRDENGKIKTATNGNTGQDITAAVQEAEAAYENALKSAQEAAAAQQEALIAQNAQNAYQSFYGGLSQAMVDTFNGFTAPWEFSGTTDEGTPMHAKGTLVFGGEGNAPTANGGAYEATLATLTANTQAANEKYLKAQEAANAAEQDALDLLKAIEDNTDVETDNPEDVDTDPYNQAPGDTGSGGGGGGGGSDDSESEYTAEQYQAFQDTYSNDDTTPVINAIEQGFTNVTSPYDTAINAAEYAMWGNYEGAYDTIQQAREQEAQNTLEGIKELIQTIKDEGNSIKDVLSKAKEGTLTKEDLRNLPGALKYGDSGNTPEIDNSIMGKRIETYKANRENRENRLNRLNSLEGLTKTNVGKLIISSAKTVEFGKNAIDSTKIAKDAYANAFGKYQGLGENQKYFNFDPFSGKITQNEKFNALGSKEQKSILEGGGQTAIDAGGMAAEMSGIAFGDITALIGGVQDIFSAGKGIFDTMKGYAEKIAQYITQAIEVVVSAWTNRKDWLYNFLNRIEKELHEFEKLQEYANQIDEGRVVSYKELMKNWDDQFESLQKQLEMQNERVEARQQYLDWSKFIPFTLISGWSPVTDTLYENRTVKMMWDLMIGFGQMVPMFGDVFKSLDELYKDYDKRVQENYEDRLEAEKAILEIETERLKLVKAGAEEATQFEEKVMDAFIQKEQEAIDELSRLNEAITGANQTLLDTLKDNLEQVRRIRENTDKEEDLTDKEIRLAYLRQDTSNANLNEIRKLEKELEKDNESYTDKLIDQRIDDLSKQNEDAATQRQKQIDLLQGQLDWAEKYGVYWDHIYGMLYTVDEYGNIGLNQENFDERGFLRANGELSKMLNTFSDLIGESIWKTLMDNEELKKLGVYYNAFVQYNGNEGIWRRQDMLQNPDINDNGYVSWWADKNAGPFWQFFAKIEDDWHDFWMNNDLGLWNDTALALKKVADFFLKIWGWITGQTFESRADAWIKEGGFKSEHDNTPFTEFFFKMFNGMLFSTAATGTDNASAGDWLVGEEGPELIQFANGGAYLAGTRGPEMVPLSNGDKVYNNSDTKQIFGRGPSFGRLAAGNATLALTEPKWIEDLVERGIKEIGNLTKNTAENNRTIVNEVHLNIENMNGDRQSAEDAAQIVIDRLDEIAKYRSTNYIDHPMR